MTANSALSEWGNEPTMVLPRYRILHVGCEYSGHIIHVTPSGFHVVDFDCEGICLVCNEPMEAA